LTKNVVKIVRHELEFLDEAINLKFSDWRMKLKLNHRVNYATNSTSPSTSLPLVTLLALDCAISNDEGKHIFFIFGRSDTYTDVRFMLISTNNSLYNLHYTKDQCMSRNCPAEYSTVNRKTI